MTGTPEECLRQIRALLADPFLGCPDLDQRERQAAILASRGVPVSDIAYMTHMARKTAYRTLDRVAAKLTAQEGRTITKDDLVEYMIRRLKEAAG
jgi:DNA-binding CsgD family transcriptional regulator